MYPNFLDLIDGDAKNAMLSVIRGGVRGLDKLVWQQDFRGGSLEGSIWQTRHGNDLTDAQGNVLAPGWGNGELQYYTDDPGNLYIDSHGLNLCARRQHTLCAGKGYAYTSARIDTRDGFAFCYGRLAVRARLPVGAGLWPAIWLLPQHQAYGLWPASGEIDMVEAKGRLPRQVFGTLHYGPDMPNKITREFSHTLPDGGIDRFHDYTLEWEPLAMRWLVDGRCYAQCRLAPGKTPFDRPFYLVLNLAVGGWYDNVAVDDTALPAVMTVEGIRLYQ